MIFFRFIFLLNFMLFNNAHHIILLFISIFFALLLLFARNFSLFALYFLTIFISLFIFYHLIVFTTSHNIQFFHLLTTFSYLFVNLRTRHLYLYFLYYEIDALNLLYILNIKFNFNKINKQNLAIKTDGYYSIIYFYFFIYQQDYHILRSNILWKE